MDRDVKSVYVPCDCGCCVLEISRSAYDDEVSYDIAVLDSRYDHAANGLWNRVRRAAKALLGKPVYFNDVCLGESAYVDLLDQMVDLLGEGGR